VDAASADLADNATVYFPRDGSPLRLPARMTDFVTEVIMVALGRPRGVCVQLLFKHARECSRSVGFVQGSRAGARRFRPRHNRLPSRAFNRYSSGMKSALLSSLAAAATLALLPGCATTSAPKLIGIAYDQGDLQRVEKSKTYHWSLPSASELNPYNNQDLYLSLVKADIDTQLAKKGYKLVEKGGDLEVSFLMLYKEDATVSVVDQYFGTNRAPERKLVHVMQQLPSTDFEIGTLIVDAEDARDHESLWRGAIMAPVNRDKPFEVQKKKINSAVGLLMTAFPTAK
jgi:hypothetical protein